MKTSRAGMFGGGFEVRKRAMSREQRHRKVDWSVAMSIGEAIVGLLGRVGLFSTVHRR